MLLAPAGLARAQDDKPATKSPARATKKPTYGQGQGVAGR